VPQLNLEELSNWFVHLSRTYLLPMDQPPFRRLANRLTNYVFGRGIGFDQIKNCPKRLRELEPLCRFNVPLGNVCIVQNEDAGRFAVPPKMFGNGYMKLPRIHV
jgi:hypothetical protein